MTTRNKSKAEKPAMSRQEAGYHEAQAGAKARAEATAAGVNEAVAEDVILSATAPGKVVRGKVLRHPARGTMLRLYRVMDVFDAEAGRCGWEEDGIRYEELSSLIMTLLYWDAHFFDDVVDKRCDGAELVRRLDAINDDPAWMADLGVLTSHMIDCNKARAQAAPGAAGEAQEGKKN